MKPNIILLALAVIIIQNGVNRSHITTLVQSEAQQNRAIESEGRCYKLVNEGE